MPKKKTIKIADRREEYGSCSVEGVRHRVIKTRVSTVTCNNCKDEIFSRARHDMRACSCGQTTIDGGFNYVKVGFNPNAGKPAYRIRYVNASEQGLYDDWNHRRNLFGKIAPKKAKHHA